MRCTVLALFLSATAWAGDIKGELRIAKEGEAVTVDLSCLKGIFGVKSAEDVRVQYIIGGNHATEKCVYVELKQANFDAGSWTCEIKGVRVSDDRVQAGTLQNRFEIEFGKQKIVVEIKPAEKRRFHVKAYGTNVGQELLQVEWNDSGDGEWAVESPKHYEVKTGDDAAINGNPMSKVSRLLSTKAGGFALVRGGDMATKEAWREVAEKHFKAALENNWDGFKATFMKAEREKADQPNSLAKTLFQAFRQTIDSNKLKEYRFDRAEGGDMEKKLFYKRFDVEGRQNGGDKPITVVFEGGWYVKTSTP